MTIPKFLAKSPLTLLATRLYIPGHTAYTDPYTTDDTPLHS